MGVTADVSDLMGDPAQADAKPKKQPKAAKAPANTQEPMPYKHVEAAAKAAEKDEGQHGRRVCKVFCEAEGAPALWYGTFGNAPVESGPAGFLFSDGQAVKL